MIFPPAIAALNLGKCHTLYARPQDRLKQFFWGKKKPYYTPFWALREVSFEVMPGEVVGIIGRNGAGKSTLLQLVCGTLFPTEGTIDVQGRIAALLELGAGFNPEFSGRENVFLNGAILGVSRAEMEARFDEIVAFSGIGDFIDQPVKTYSSGMYVRLAFSVAVHIDPDILIIDEALSVGDGAFSRKSFERIMALKEKGATILFCSHSMYQVEVLCQKAIWLEKGRVRMIGPAQEVTAAYSTALVVEATDLGRIDDAHLPDGKNLSLETKELTEKFVLPALAAPGTGRITRLVGLCNGEPVAPLVLRSESDTLSIQVFFVIDPTLPCPRVALALETCSGVVVTTAISSNAADELLINAQGEGAIQLNFPKIPILKGEYLVSVFLLCEHGLQSYDGIYKTLPFTVVQESFYQGLCLLPCNWSKLLK
jgi:lipopolysaccharide transport system ATP-binding protein